VVVTFAECMTSCCASPSLQMKQVTAIVTIFVT